MLTHVSKILKIGMVFLAACVLSYGMHAYSVKNSPIALNVLGRCFAATEDQTFAATCLNRTIKVLLNTYTTKQVMAYVTASTTQSSIIQQCHPIGHIVGEFTYQKYQSIEGALAQCSEDCRSACVHGVIGAGVTAQMGQGYPGEDIAHANTGELERLGNIYCDNSDSTCHAMGHVAYIATQKDTDALTICDNITKDPYRRETCYQGVFMERAGNFENVLDPSGSTTPPEVRHGDYTYPCTSLGEQYHHACFLFLNSYQTTLFQQDAITSPAAKLEKAREVCESLPDSDRADCFNGIGNSSLRIFSNEARPSNANFCAQFPNENDRAACTLGVISIFLFNGTMSMHQYCEKIDDAKVRTVCIEAAFEFALAAGKSIDGPTGICHSDQSCLDSYKVFTDNRQHVPDYRLGFFGQKNL